MQRLSSTTGRIWPLAPLTIEMADAGQWRTQLPHVWPYAAEIQMPVSTRAIPMPVRAFSEVSIGSIAPVGQTSLQRVHSGRQKPAVNAITGCIKPSRLVSGLRTSLGHSLTQS